MAAGDVYLRAGSGLDRPAETAFKDRNCSSTAPAALYGCGRGGDGAPYRSRGDFGTVPVLGVGLGYIAAPAARLEVLVEYRPRFSFEGHANFREPARRQSVAADLSARSGMVAGYVDLPGLGLPKIGPFGPFIGAGVGVVRTRDRANPHDFSEDDDHCAGREPGRPRLDADGRGLRWRWASARRSTSPGVIATSARSAPAGARAVWSGATGVVNRGCSISPQRGRISRATGSCCPCAARSKTGDAAHGHRRNAVHDGLRA